MQKKNENSIIYCLCLHDQLLDKVKNLNYVPVGLGKEKFSVNWLRDDIGKNISNKNEYYGEYSFHYWLWKNKISNLPDNTWIGFCTYRRFWSNKKNSNSNKIEEKILQNIPSEWDKYEVILGDQFNVQGIKWMKVLKYGKKALLTNPGAILKKNRNIKFQFDLFHGVGLIDKAIDVLDEENKEDFREYINKNVSYNQGNMFITRSKKIMNMYYSTVFQWLNECEKIFGYDLKGYNKVRIYAFLAERFLPYWFNKNTKTLEWPIIFHDLNDS
tara:strand:- start:863 stop:1675 length:813 start_codon:yes stop_codon:yes gene_type:complete